MSFQAEEGYARQDREVQGEISGKKLHSMVRY
jgi:hypothetical protein